MTSVVKKVGLLLMGGDTVWKFAVCSEQIGAETRHLGRSTGQLR